MFRKLICGFAFLCVTGISVAGTANVDVTGLSDAQVAELRAIAAAKVAETAKAETKAAATPLDVGKFTQAASTWGQQAATAAEGFAKALGIAARELGVTVNDFLKTDAGKLAAIVIMWKLVGSSFVHLLFSILVLIIGLSVARVIYLRLFTQSYEKVEYKRFGDTFTGTKLVRIPKSFKDLHNDGEWLAFWVMMATIGGSILISALVL